MWKLLPEFRKSLKRKRKEKTRKLDKELDKEVFGEMESWPAMATAWFTIRKWFASGALKTNKQDTTATPGPAQPLFPESEEEEDEDEVLFREKEDDHEEDKGVTSDYDESEAEMTEEMVLKKLEKELTAVK